MPSGVYAILNKVNGKSYIGSTVDLVLRRKQHFWDLRSNSHANRKLQHSWRKHGENAFAFSTLLVCSREHLEFFEQRAIDAYDSVENGYNIVPRAKKGWSLGMRHSQEARKKMALKATGRVMSRESVEKSRLANLGRQSPRKGATLSETTKEKLRRANLGKQLAANHPFKFGWFKGKTRRPRTEEEKQKISRALTGRKGPPCTNAIQLAQQRAKFDANQVSEFRRRFDGGETATALAREHGCSLSTMHRIVTRQNYKHLEVKDA